MTEPGNDCLAARQTSFGGAARACLGVEVLVTYVHVRVLLRRYALPEVVRRLRTTPRRPVVGASEPRLAYVVRRVLRFVPADTRCLMQSLVLLGVLEHRSISSTLVIGASSDGGFAAHAWIERGGEALLWAGGPTFGRLTEL